MSATKVNPTAAKPEKAPKAPKAEKPPKAPKEKIVRVEYPGLTDADGKPVKFQTAEIPADYSRKIHTDLKRKHFASEDLYYTMMANRAKAHMESFLLKAEDAKKVGNVADKKRAKKLLKMREQMAELRKQLEEQNIDVDALFAAASAG